MPYSLTEETVRRLEVDAEGRHVAVHHEISGKLCDRLFWEIVAEFDAASEEAAFLRLDDRFFSLPRELSPTGGSTTVVYHVCWQNLAAGDLVRAGTRS